MWVKSTHGHMHNLDRFDTISMDYPAIKKPTWRKKSNPRVNTHNMRLIWT